MRVVNDPHPHTHTHTHARFKKAQGKHGKTADEWIADTSWSSKEAKLQATTNWKQAERGLSPHELLLAAKKIFEGIVFDFEFRMKVSETTVSTRFAYI